MLERIRQVPRSIIYISAFALLVCTGVSFFSHPRTKDVQKVFWDNLQDLHAAMGRTKLEDTREGRSLWVANSYNSSEDNARFVTPLKQAQLQKWNEKVNKTDTWKALGMEALDQFAWMAKQLNISWWMSFGTLLGSYRHHGMTPWDLDYDVVIRKKDALKLMRAFGTPKLFDKSKFWTRARINEWCYTNATIKSKPTQSDPRVVYDEGKICIYMPKSKRPSEDKIGGGSFTLKNLSSLSMTKIYRNTGYWRENGQPAMSPPQVDIVFLEENSTHLWHDSSHYAVEKSVTFPLVMRPFNGRMFPGPRDPKKALKQTYDDGVFIHCITRGPYALTAKCASLVNVFPFVRHSRGAGGAYCREDLEIAGVVNSSFVRSAEKIPEC